MFVQLCKELDFPAESLAVLEKAYLSVIEDPNINILFENAKDALVHPHKICFDEAMEKILELTDLHPYTLNVVLCISCLESLSKTYEELALKDKFNKYAKQLKTQLVSCRDKFDIWGIKEGFWQWMFHEWQSVQLGRLEFEPFHHFCDVPYKGIKKGDPVILIHIPGGKPLDMDGVIESLRLAYNQFKNRFANETVPFVTHSWLIYPPYINGVYKEGSNLKKFAELFDIIAENQEKYINFSNIFGCPYPGKEELCNLPQKTSLQRNMLQFVKQGNSMGQGYGIFFYDKDGIVKN